VYSNYGIGIDEERNFDVNNYKQRWWSGRVREVEEEE
jgi:hypothetical protein